MANVIIMLNDRKRPSVSGYKIFFSFFLPNDTIFYSNFFVYLLYSNTDNKYITHISALKLLLTMNDNGNFY